MILQGIIEQLQKISPSDISQLSYLIESTERVILLGNGGSNAIASHIMVDYIKFLQKDAVAFTDASQLTAYANDYTLEHAFANYIYDSSLGEVDDNLVILISSSGNSKNIYNAAEFCVEEGFPFVLLTGFSPDNDTRRDFGDKSALDFWVNSSSYGVVENVHQIFLHSVVDN